MEKETKNAKLGWLVRRRRDGGEEGISYSGLTQFHDMKKSVGGRVLQETIRVLSLHDLHSY